MENSARSTTVNFNQKTAANYLDDVVRLGVNSKLSYWLAQDAENNLYQKRFRRPHHEFEAELTFSPLLPESAYRQLGMLLGIIPPAVIFFRVLIYFTDYGREPSAVFFAIYALLINLVCAIVGRAAGGCFSNMAFELERSSWIRMLLIVPLIGLLWGAITGLVSGFIFIGFGALAGLLILSPIGAIGFTAYAVFHRLLERGTVISNRHSLPLAFGISSVIAGFVLGL